MNLRNAPGPWLETIATAIAAVWTNRLMQAGMALGFIVLLFGADRVAKWIESMGAEGVLSFMGGVAAALAVRSKSDGAVEAVLRERRGIMRTE